MHRATHLLSSAMLSALILVCLMPAVSRGHPAQENRALSEQEVLELLEGGVASARVGEIVDERGITFEFTSEIEQKVRDAGGAEDVVSALRKASKAYTQSVQPRTGGLVVKTTPGESQVYLNDEPKGMTSPEGEIRLRDLPPADYTLRVSLTDYQSNEQTVTIKAGEEQTVYVTLTHKPPPAIPPTNSNSHPAAATPPVNTTLHQALPLPTSGIPVSGVKVGALQFYEGPHDLILNKSERIYRYIFDHSTARTIWWELNLTYPAPGQRIDFAVDAVWYKADGAEFFRHRTTPHVETAWRSSWHTDGYGFAQPGRWPTGTYRVDLFCNNARIATGTFQIN